MNINFNPSGQSPKSIFSQILAALFGVVALVAALMFSAVVFVGLAIAGVAFWAYFRWKTRVLRRQMEEQLREQGFEAPPRESTGNGDIIEGESIRLDDDRRMLP